MCVYLFSSLSVRSGQVNRQLGTLNTNSSKTVKARDTFDCKCEAIFLGQSRHGFLNFKKGIVVRIM